MSDLTVGRSRWQCGLQPLGIAGSNPAEGMDVRLLFVVCVGSGLCDERIIRWDELYHVCASRDRETLTRPEPQLGICATGGVRGDAQPKHVLKEVNWVTPDNRRVHYFMVYWHRRQHDVNSSFFKKYDLTGRDVVLSCRSIISVSLHALPIPLSFLLSH
jgi:hypothetical protein